MIEESIYNGEKRSEKEREREREREKEREFYYL